jgi:saccharopine dehydrogenase-like NADP-dependent oxidoreductase
VMVLGGAGFQGTQAASLLHARSEVADVVLGDLHLEAAEQAASKIGPKCRGVAVDATDVDAIASALATSSIDVVLNCAGPFRRIGTTPLDAAIRAGAHYVDLLDDAHVVPAFFRCSDAAERAGITAAIGFGFSPGLTDILGKLAIRDMSDVDELHWSYLCNPTLSVEPHLMSHRVQLFGRRAGMIVDGQLRQVHGGSEAIEVEWPGFGRLTASVIAHPEPVLAHRYLPHLRRAVVRASYTTDSFGRMLATLGELGFDSEQALGGPAGDLSPEEFIGQFLTSDVFQESRVWREVVDAEERLGDVDAARVVAKGRRGGEETARGYLFLGRKRWQSTYTVGAIAAYLVGTGELRRPGVHAPEAFEAERLVEECQRSGLGIEEIDARDAPEFAFTS